MKKLVLVAVAFVFALGIPHPPAAEARVGVYANFGCCAYGGGYYPYGPYPPAYYYPYAVAPPPVIYAVPPPSPIVYSAPPAYVAAPAPAPVATPATAAVPVVGSSTSPTYIDGQGRTCRQFQATNGGQTGTACLQPDGSWRAVQ